MSLLNDNGNYTEEVVNDGSVWEGEISWETWVEKYKPTKNHITKYPDPQSEFESFETYGAEWEYIKSLDPKLVWTEIQGDMSMLLVAGIGFVNRLCYYVCEEPWETGDEQVLISVEVECKCYDEDKFEWGGDPDCDVCEGNGTYSKYV